MCVDGWVFAGKKIARFVSLTETRLPFFFSFFVVSSSSSFLCVFRVFVKREGMCAANDRNEKRIGLILEMYIHIYTYILLALD